MSQTKNEIKAERRKEVKIVWSPVGCINPGRTLTLAAWIGRDERLVPAGPETNWTSYLVERADLVEVEVKEVVNA